MKILKKLLLLLLVVYNSKLKAQNEASVELERTGHPTKPICDSIYSGIIVHKITDLKQQKKAIKFGTDSYHFRAKVSDLPRKKRLVFYQYVLGRPDKIAKKDFNPTIHEDVDFEYRRTRLCVWMFNKNWYEGYITNKYFYFNATATYKNREDSFPSIFIEDIDDYFKLEIINNTPFDSPQKNIIDSVYTHLQSILSTQKKEIGFEYVTDTLKENTFQLEIKEEINTQKQKNIKIYLIEKISNQKYEWFNLSDLNWKKQKPIIEKNIKQNIGLYIIPWEKRLDINNTKQPLRVVWEDLPIQFETPLLDWRKKSMGLPRENTLISTNLTIFLHNIIVRQQKYGNKKFDFFLKKQDDNFKGKTLYLKTKLDFDTKNTYSLKLSMEGKETKTIFFNENRIADNDMAESNVDLVNILQKWIQE